MTKVMEQHIEGNTIDMVKLVRKKEENRVSKINNFAHFHHYRPNAWRQDMTNNWRKGLGDQKVQFQNDLKQQHFEQQKKYAKLDDNYQGYEQSRPSPTNRQRYSPSPDNRHYGMSGRGFNRSERQMFRPSQMRLVDDIEYRERSRVIGWVLIVLFVILYLQFVLVGMGLFGQNYLSYESDNRMRVYNKGAISVNKGEVSDQSVASEQLKRAPHTTSTIKTTNPPTQYPSPVVTPPQPLPFTTILFLFSLCECLYHLVVYAIQSYSPGQSLIDEETSRFSFILHCRDFDSRESSTLLEKVTKSPKFTFLLVIVSTLMYCIGLVRCFYEGEFNLLYGNWDDDVDGYTLLEVLFYGVVLPDVMAYLFFDEMHLLTGQKQSNLPYPSFKYIRNINIDCTKNQQYPLTSPFESQPTNKQQLESISQTDNRWSVPPLTRFDHSKWWLRLALGVFFLSVVYSVLGRWWLVVMSFGRIEMEFVKRKYRVDTFYVEWMAKVVFVVVLGAIIGYEKWQANQLLSIYDMQTINSQQRGNLQPQQGQESSVIPFSSYLIVIVTFTTSLLVSRLLAQKFIKQQLYKHFFTEAKLITYTLVGSFVAWYFISEWFAELALDWLSIVVMVILSIGLIIGVWNESREREEVEFMAERESENWVEMADL